MPLPDDQVDALLRGEHPEGDGMLADAPQRALLADLFAAAAGPPTDDELASSAAAASWFAARAGRPSAVSSARGRPPARRATRVPRRVIGVTVGVLLTAGTAAAASGALGTSRPAWPSAGRAEATPSTAATAVVETSVVVTVAADTTVEPTVAVSEPAPPTLPSGTAPAQGPDASGPAVDGLCIAWSHGHQQHSDNPALGALEAAADAADQTVEEYCADVLDAEDEPRGTGRHDDGGGDSGGGASGDHDRDHEGDGDPRDDQDHGQDHGQGQGSDHGDDQGSGGSRDGDGGGGHGQRRSRG